MNYITCKRSKICLYNWTEVHKIAKNINLSGQIHGLDNVTIRCLGQEELINIAKRLTRFENPINKSLTINKNLIFKATVSPKINNKTFERLQPSTIDSLASQIWNKSVENIGITDNDEHDINLYIVIEEIKGFSSIECLKELIFSDSILFPEYLINIDRLANSPELTPEIIENIKSILQNNGFNLEFFNDKRLDKLSYIEKLYVSYRMSFPMKLKAFIDNLEGNHNNNIKYPIGIKRLLEINNLIKNFKKTEKPDNLLEKIYQLNPSLRKKLGISAPPNLIMLVEGITEELLLPKFAQLLGYDFNKDGIHIISAGGKNQVNRLYNKFRELLNLPIVILLDADAIEISNDLKLLLNKKDKVIIIQKGEFEDILSNELVCKAINNEFMLSPGLKLSDIKDSESMVQQLCTIWRNFGLGDFNKSEFAGIIHKHINDNKHITKEMTNIIREIYTLL